MNLAGRYESRTLRAALAPWADGVKVRGRAPFVTPWRTIQLADRLEELAPSVLGLKLNPPSRVADASAFRPMKYDGIWWGMHLGVMTWGEGPKHGATTANTKRYVDFAAANGLGGTLVEGWNVGWDGDWMKNRNGFSFTQPYPDYDLPGLAAYAKSKGVALIAHNETAMGVENYERQLDSAFSLYRRLGIHAIKTGYVNDKTLEGHSHTGQYMVRHYRRVVETAAKYGIAVDVHEPIKDTGERRTWPNMMSREGARGQEYNAWGARGEGRGGTRPSTRRSSSSRACSPARWTSRRGSSTSAWRAPRGRRARRKRHGRARRSPSSSRSTSSSTRPSRWRRTCPRTTGGSRPSSSSGTSPWTGTRRA
jgi:alpha-glucosidase